MIQIMTHVIGEHLGEWERDLLLLEDIQANPFFQDTDQPTIHRSKALNTRINKYRKLNTNEYEFFD